MKQHQGHECTRRRRAAMRMRTEQMAKVRGVFAEIGANGRFAFGGAIAFVEDQVEDLVHGVEPLDELRGVGRLERDVMVDQVARRALESLLDRFFGDQECAGDFGDAKAAEVFKVRASWFSRASTGWQQAKIIRSWLSSIDVSRNRSSIPSSSAGRCGPAPRFTRRAISVRRSESRTLFLATRWTQAEGLSGIPATPPRLQGVEQSGLDHFLDEVEVPPAEETGQHGHQSPRLAAEEMLHERSDRFRLCRGHR